MSLTDSAITMSSPNAVVPSVETIPFTLHLDTATLIAGDTLLGHIALDLSGAQADRLIDLQLELRGSYIT
jgi:hypothetical protein